MLSYAFAVLSFGSIGLSAQSAAPIAPTVSRVHQLEIEDQSENPGNISAADITSMAMPAARRYASFSRMGKLPQEKTSLMLR